MSNHFCFSSQFWDSEDLIDPRPVDPTNNSKASVEKESNDLQTKNHENKIVAFRLQAVSKDVKYSGKILIYFIL